MTHPHIHTRFWIEELNSYGIRVGSNGEPLEKLDYYELRALVVQQKLKRNLETKASPWF